MARIECEITYTVGENEKGFDQEITRAYCTRCGNETVSYGHGKLSVKRCLALMNEQCPRGENNFYVDGDE